MKCKKCGSDTWVGVETSLCDNCKPQKSATIDREAQQAQTIAIPRYRAVHKLSQMTTEQDGDWVQYETHKQIVDSQAQKITQQDSEIRAQKSALEVAAELLPKSRKERDEQAQKIADQAKIIATNAAYAIELQGKLSEQEKQLGLMTLGIRSRDVKIAEQAKELDSAKSLAGIATNRFFEAKHSAEKYRNAYVDANARRDGHHPKSMIQAELLPWEKWDAKEKCVIDLTETTDSKEG